MYVDASTIISNNKRKGTVHRFPYFDCVIENMWMLHAYDVNNGEITDNLPLFSWSSNFGENN